MTSMGFAAYDGARGPGGEARAASDLPRSPMYLRGEERHAMDAANAASTPARQALAVADGLIGA